MIRKLLFAVTLLYTVLLITRPQEFTPGLADLPLLQILVLVAFGIWLFTPNKGIELPQFRLIPLFLIAVWLSLGIGAGWWGGFVPAMERLLPPILLFVIVSGCVRTTTELRTYSTVVIACACVLVLHGHLQKTTGLGWTGQPMIEGRITYTGIFDDPNDLGLLIVTSLALAMWHVRTQSGWLLKSVFLAAIGWLLYGVYLTDSRGTLLATLLIIGLQMWRSYGKVAVGIAAALAVPVLVAFTRLSELNADEDSAAGRFEAWYEGIQELVLHPIFGIGWDMFPDIAYGLTAHNSWVLAMVELGMFGYTFWFAFVALTGWMVYRLAFPDAPNGKPTAVKPSARSNPWAVQQRRPAAVTHPAAAAHPAAASRGYQVSIAHPYARPHNVYAAGHAHAHRRDGGASSSEAGGSTVASVADAQAAFYLLLAASGFAFGAFFLSQSYKAMLFMNCGLIVGHFLGLRESGVAVPKQPGYSTHLFLMFGLAAASVVAIWLLVKVLV